MKTVCGIVVALISFSAVFGCDKSAETGNLKVEKLPEVRPNLPAVPTLPPAPYPLQYTDKSYSVYGLRKKSRDTMDKDVSVTGFIVEVYRAPKCEKDKPCPRAIAPHVWISDVSKETDAAKRLSIVGYADNQDKVDEAVAKAKHGAYKPPPDETGLPPIPTDFDVGAKIRVRGHFTRLSGTGFNQSDGLLEYQGHETLEKAPN
jgi:hypothetical protein